MKLRLTRRKLLAFAGMLLCAGALAFLAALRPLQEVSLEQAPFFVESMSRIERAVQAAPGAVGVPELAAGSSRVEIAPPLECDPGSPRR